jgi:UDP-N-acetyl-D-glucosamine dehydrogenase
MINKILTQIMSDTASVGIVGLGYVGLPLALRFAEVGIKVLGFDIDQTPDGHFKFPHPWPPQIPPGKTAGL